MSKESIPNYEKIKKEVSEEGWEGSAALTIGGTEEERKVRRERLESEGNTKDLGTYIKMHKEIVLPKEEATDKTKELLEKNKGRIVEDNIDGNSFCIRYIDKDANVAQVFIQPEKIAEFKGFKIGRLETNKKLDEGLKSLGFSEYARAAVGESEEVQNLSNRVHKQVIEYKYRLEKKAKEAKKEAFDF